MSLFSTRQLLYAVSISLFLLASLPAHAAISLNGGSVNNATSSTTVNSNNNDTLNWTHTLAAGTNRKLIVTVGIEDGNNANTIVNTVTFGDKTLTPAGNIRVTSNFTQNVEVWYLDEVDISTVSGNQITITTIGNVDEMSGGAIVFNDAYQGAPPVVTNSNSNTDFISTTTNITPPANSWIMDVIGSGNRDPNFSSGASQNQLWNERNSSSRFKASYKTNISVNTTMSQDQNNANRLAHIVITLPPFGAVLPPPPPPPPSQTCIAAPILPNNQDVNAIAGSGDNNIIAVADNTGGGGGNGQISIFNGTEWILQTDPDIPNEDFNDVYVFSSSSSVVVGDDGTVLIQSGTDPDTAWSALNDPTSEDLTTVWAYSANEIYVAGDDGQIHLWNGSLPWIDLTVAANTDTSGNDADDFVDSWGDANNVYFLTDEGKIFIYDRSQAPTSSSAWSSTTPNCITGNVDINGFTSDGAGNFYLVGERRISQPGPDPDVAVIYKWDGTNCNIVYQSIVDNTELNAISINPDGVFTAVGDDGLILSSTDENNWTDISSGGDDINAVYTTANGRIIFSADNNNNLICANDEPHFEISFVDGSPTTDGCTAKAIQIAYHDINHNITPFVGTINISTSTNNGDWSINSAPNAITNNGNGSASYTFLAGDPGVITLDFTSTTAETLNINILDPVNLYSDFISEDPNLVVTGATPGTYLDTFSNQSYSNSDGTLDWASLPWTELDAGGGGASGGDARIGGNRLRIETLGTSVSRAVDLSAYTGVSSARLLFNYRGRQADTGQDKAAVQYSVDGGVSFTLLQEFDGPLTNNFDEAIPLTTTHIRFLITSSYQGNGERFEIDNVQVAITTPCSNTIDHFSINYSAGDTGTGINCQASTITIEAHDDNHQPVIDYVGTINLSTKTKAAATSFGDWSNTSIPADAYSAVLPIGTDSGTATYEFVLADEGQVSLSFKNTHTEITELNILEGAFSETSNNAVLIDDFEIDFASSGFNFLADTVKDTIGLQIGGKPSNVSPDIQSLELQAVKTNTTTGACESVLQGPQSIDLAFECTNPSSCTNNNLEISFDNGLTYEPAILANNNGASPLSYSTVTGFDFGDTADTTASFVMRYNDVGSIKLHARKIITPSNEKILGISTNFVVRPFAFYISVPSNPASATAAENPFTAAGNDFAVNLNAVLWQSEDDAGVSDGIADGHTDTDPSNNANLSNNAIALNYGQEIAPNNAPATSTEQVVLSANLFLPNPGTHPGLDDSSANNKRITSFNPASGIGATSTVNYDEVGIIELHSSVSDNNYLDIGSTETAKIIGASSYVGRFFPNHFDTSVIEGCTINNNYSYSGQPISVTALARNTSGLPTVNYEGDFSYLTTLSNAAVSPIINFTNNTIPAANFVNGIGTRTDVIYTYPNKDTSPTIITLRANDADTGSSIGIAEGLTEIRSGRTRLENVFGSELLPLTIPIRAEYFSNNGTATTADDGYILNSDDSCSAYDAATATLVNFNGNLTTGEVATTGTGSLALGIAAIVFHKPGDVTLGPGLTNDGSVNLLLNTADWLEYNWTIDCDGDSANDFDPCGIASFGLYRGDDRVIYWREVF